MSTMPHIKEFFINHPLVGAVSSILGAAPALIETVTPFLQLLGVIVGLAIGVLTLAIKYQQWRKGQKQK